MPGRGPGAVPVRSQVGGSGGLEGRGSPWGECPTGAAGPRMPPLSAGHPGRPPGASWPRLPGNHPGPTGGACRGLKISAPTAADRSARSPDAWHRRWRSLAPCSPGGLECVLPDAGVHFTHLPPSPLHLLLPSIWATKHWTPTPAHHGQRRAAWPCSMQPQAWRERCPPYPPPQALDHAVLWPPRLPLAPRTGLCSLSPPLSHLDSSSVLAVGVDVTSSRQSSLIAPVWIGPHMCTLSLAWPRPCHTCQSDLRGARVLGARTHSRTPRPPRARRRGLISSGNGGRIEGRTKDPRAAQESRFLG